MATPPLYKDRSRDGDNLSDAIENPGPVDPSMAVPLRAHSIANLAELRRTVGSASGNAGPRACILAGQLLPLDAGAGVFVWDPASKLADNALQAVTAFTVARVQGVPTGCWRRLTTLGPTVVGSTILANATYAALASQAVSWAAAQFRRLQVYISYDGGGVTTVTMTGLAALSYYFDGNYSNGAAGGFVGGNAASNWNFATSAGATSSGWLMLEILLPPSGYKVAGGWRNMDHFTGAGAGIVRHGGIWSDDVTNSPTGITVNLDAARSGSFYVVGYTS